MAESRQTLAHILQRKRVLKKYPMFSGFCEIKDCNNKATRLSAKADGGIIDICDTCWHMEYKS